MMTIRQIFNDGLSMLGIQNQDTSPQTARDHVLQDITAALQLMQMAGEEFYCREEATVNLVIGTGYYDLPAAVQTVLGPVRLSAGHSLLGLASRRQLDDFGPLFLGASGAVANAIPMAYFVEALRVSAASDGEGCKVRLHVVPKPAAADTLTVNVINEPPVYTSAHLSGTSPTPPVPHKYHESILLPLVRMNVTTCDLFARNAAKYPMIEADYQRALTLLGLADPRQPKPPGSKTDALRSTAKAPQS
jgi:hypothetical protein